jgi:hypothetical protein
MADSYSRGNAHGREKYNEWHSKSWDDKWLTSPTAIPLGFTTPSNMLYAPPSAWPTERPTVRPSIWTEEPPQWGSSTFSTSTYTQASTYSSSSTSKHTTAPGPVASLNVSPPSSTTVNNSGDTPLPGVERKGHTNHGAMYAVAGVVPVVVVTFIGLVVFLCLRKRKRQRRDVATSQVKTQAIQKKSQQSSMAPHHIFTPSSPPPIARPHYATVPTQLSPLQAPALPTPVILGPIGSGPNGAYLTGIDTSEVMSVDDRTGLGNPFADGDSLKEEPPPPYRPRSVSLSSRNCSLQQSFSSHRSSLRQSPFTHPQTNLVAQHDQNVRSPFADPDDDTVSDVSVPSMRSSCVN